MRRFSNGWMTIICYMSTFRLYDTDFSFGRLKGGKLLHDANRKVGEPTSTPGVCRRAVAGGWRYTPIGTPRNSGGNVMHDTAFMIGSKFLELYASGEKPVIVELGSYAVNGSLRPSCPSNGFYLGLDLEHGPSVDIVVSPRQPLPMRSDFADLVLSSSQLEHDPFFWQTFLELLRILK